jgi:hypothetical protein
MVVDYGEINKNRNINMTCGEEHVQEVSYESSMYDIHMEIPTPTYMEVNMRLGPRETGCERIDFTELTQYKAQWWNFLYTIMNIKIP